MTTYGSLGEISDSRLQAALDRFGLGRLVRAEAFTDGLFGKNVGVTTDTGRWVLRGDPWPAHCDDQFRCERFWASQVRTGCDVPVPWPFHIDADESLLGWPYQLTPWMPGVQDRSLTGAAALGRAAAELRQVTFPSFGRWSGSTDDVEPFAGSAAAWLAHRVEGWIGRCAEQARPLAASDLDFVHGLLPTDIDAVPTYVHHDLKVGNCVCTDGVVTGIFDLGEGLVGDPLEDLARATWDLARTDEALVLAFLDTYESAAGVTIDRGRLWSYVVLDLLVIWEYGTRPAQAWFDEPTFEAWVLSFAEPVVRALARSQ